MIEREKEWQAEKERWAVERQSFIEKLERAQSDEFNTTSRLHVELEIAKEKSHKLEKWYEKKLQER